MADVRQATSADIPDLVRIENLSFAGDRLSSRSLRRLVTRRTACTLVAVAGKAIAGYAMLLFRRNLATARLYSLAVDPEFIGKGIGRLLVYRCETESLRRGCTRLRLEVRADNMTAIRLYEQLGFEPIGIRPGYYTDGCDAIRYGKALRRRRSGK